MSDKPRLKMIKPWNPESEEWQVNLPWQSKARVRPSLGMLLEKYAGIWQRSMFQRLGVLNGRGHPDRRCPSGEGK
jgi:hypothetical protein